MLDQKSDMKRTIIAAHLQADAARVTQTPAPTVATETQPSTPEPTPFEMVQNFAGAIGRFARSGFKLASPELFEERITICRQCTYWREDARLGLSKCTHEKCGCTKFKHHLASEKCPIGKW